MWRTYDATFGKWFVPSVLIGQSRRYYVLHYSYKYFNINRHLTIMMHRHPEYLINNCILSKQIFLKIKYYYANRLKENHIRSQLCFASVHAFSPPRCPHPRLLAHCTWNGEAPRAEPCQNFSWRFEGQQQRSTSHPPSGEPARRSLHCNVASCRRRA